MGEFEHKAKAAAERSTQAVEQSYTAAAENVREYMIKMINMAQANTESVFEFARQIANAKAPSDLTEVWAAQARRQLEMLNEQTRQLASLGQKMARESTEPIVRTTQQAFDKAS
jgi:hypothetical protein